MGGQASGGDVSLLPRDHAKRRACMRGPREAQDGREATGRRVSVGTGTVEATGMGVLRGRGRGQLSHRMDGRTG